MRILLLTVLAGVICGCAPFTTYQTAEVTSPGAVRGGVCASLPIFLNQWQSSQDTSETQVSYPVPEFILRAGILPWLDAGVKMTAIACFLADAKFNIVHTRRFFLSPDLGLGWEPGPGIFLDNDVRVWTIVPAIIATLRINDFVALTAAPKYFWLFAPGDEGNDAPGLTANLAFGKRLMIIAEADVFWGDKEPSLWIAGLSVSYEMALDFFKFLK